MLAYLQIESCKTWQPRCSMTRGSVVVRSGVPPCPRESDCPHDDPFPGGGRRRSALADSLHL